MTDKTESDLYVYPGKRVTQAGHDNGFGQGMTLRDHFASQVLAGWISSAVDHEVYLDPAHYADMSYEFADAMMARRKK